MNEAETKLDCLFTPNQASINRRLSICAALVASLINYASFCANPSNHNSVPVGFKISSNKRKQFAATYTSFYRLVHRKFRHDPILFLLCDYNNKILQPRFPLAHQRQALK